MIKIFFLFASAATFRPGQDSNHRNPGGQIRCRNKEWNMMMKRKICLILTLVMVMLALSACGKMGGGKTADASPSQPQSTEKEEDKKVSGIINQMGDYLVLLTGDGEYQVMDYGKGVSADGFEEGDSVEITYTGELGVEGSNPVITAISKAK